MPIRSGNEAIAGGGPPPITGNLTATLPVAVSAIRQVIGGVADISINTFAGGAPGAVPNSMGGVINYLREDGTWAVPAGAAHDLLSITHPDTLPAAVVKGDVVVGNATPKWSRLPANATGIKKYLQSYSGGVPSWEQVDYGDLSGSDPYWGYIRRYGFVNRSTTTLAFNDGTYELTLAPTGSSWAYMRYGVVHVIAGSKTVTLAGAPPAAGLYYVYIDSTNGTLIADTIGWDLNDTKVPVCYLWWNNANTPKYWLGEERHECIVDRGWHREHHFAEGTEWLSGAVLAGYTVNPPGPVDTDNTFSISQMSMVDEDIFLTLAALVDPGGVANAYVNIYLAGGSWTWEESPVPLKYSGAGYIQYDNAGVMTAGSSANFYNTYLYASNFDGMARWSIVSGKAEFSSVSNAQAENPLTFNFSGFPAQEGIVLYQLTWRTSNSYGTLGKCRLAAAPKKIKITLTGTVGGGTPPHNSLPGLQGGSYPSEYYHLSEAEWSGIQTLSGGLSGQVPYKLSDASWDIGWTTLSGGGGSLTVETVDGLLSIPNVTKIKVSNGTLINNGGGTVTIATGDGMIPGIPYTSSFSVTVAIGDALEFRGSANKVMRLYELYFAKPNVNVVVTGIKRSTADTGGTSSNATVVPHDSTDPSASCILKLYTVAPSAGVAVGTIFREAVSGALDRVSNRFDVGKGITLRGATESFAVTVDVACLLHGWARWTEE